jgi:hypothetical protein
MSSTAARYTSHASEIYDVFKDDAKLSRDGDSMARLEGYSTFTQLWEKWTRERPQHHADKEFLWCVCK